MAHDHLRSQVTLLKCRSDVLVFVMVATDMMALFTSSSFRALYTPDVMGVEVGGAVKNVIAIAAGMSEGLGLGTNAMAALVTRGCGEMRRLVTTLGGESSTVCGMTIGHANFCGQACLVRAAALSKRSDTLMVCGL